MPCCTLAAEEVCPSVCSSARWRLQHTHQHQQGVVDGRGHAQGGAALAVAFKTHDAKIKGLALPSALSAFMGITEPAIFGVNLRFFKPFIAGCIGGGCGALVCALTSLAASGTGVTGIFGILLCLAQPVQYAIMFAVAALVSFAVSFVLYKDEPKASVQA